MSKPESDINSVTPGKPMDRRRMLTTTGSAGAAVVGASIIPHIGLAAGVRAEPAMDDRILVVLELSGGNDGLNTLVPYHDDAYYRHRPHVGIKPDALRPIDDEYGFNAGMAGFEGLYKNGWMAVVHGCGYENPSFSHFTSMAYWHTAAPNSGAQYGWVGRLADALKPGGAPSYLVNIDDKQSLAVTSRDHTPLVFDEPDSFVRKGRQQARSLIDRVDQSGVSNGSTGIRRYLNRVAKQAEVGSALVRDAWEAYRTPMDYGLVPLDLPKVAAMIHADLPTRLYYTSYRNNAFDTHVHQNNLHRRLLTYTSDAVTAFFEDMRRIGKADKVVMLVFSEFGRRVGENANLGTDHGTSNAMFVIGKPVRGGHYGTPPDLTKLDDTDNLIPTSDFRRTYASVTNGWLGIEDNRQILGGDFAPFDIFPLTG